MRTFIFIFFLFSSLSWSQVSLRSLETRVFGSGEVIKAEITIDSSLYSKNLTASLEGTSIDEKILFYKINNKEESVGDKIVLKSELIFTKNYKNEESLTILINNKNIFISLSGFNFDSKLNKEKEKPEILKTDFNFDITSLPSWVLLSILSLVFISMILVKPLKKIFLQRNKKKKWLLFLDNLELINKREHLEALWLDREKIRSRWPNTKEEFDNFWKILNQYQFKSEISDEEFKKILNSFRELKVNLRQYDRI